MWKTHCMKTRHMGHIVIAIGEAVNCKMSPRPYICPFLYYSTYFDKTFAFHRFLEHDSNLHCGRHSYCEPCEETTGNFSC